MQQLKPTKAAKAIEACIDMRQPACLWGQPGIGKSDIFRQIAAKRNMQYIDFRAVLRNPVDLMGLPQIDAEGYTRFRTPGELPRDGAGILVLEEVNRAPQMMQNACLQLVLDRAIGEYRLPDPWHVFAACNFEGDGGGITRMNPALSNRFEHLEMCVDVQDWSKWACANNIEPVVIAFMRAFPQHLHAFSKTDHAWPSPRSWSFVSKVVALKMTDPEVEHAKIQGNVGHSAAIDFSSYKRLYASIPSIDGIALNPQSAPVPTDPGTLYAVSSAIARYANDANFGKLAQYLDRIPQEYAVHSVRDAVTRTPSIMTTRDFTTWSVNHQDITIG